MRFMLTGNEMVNWIQAMNISSFLNDLKEDDLNKLVQRFSYFLLLNGINETEYKSILNLGVLNPSDDFKNIITKDDFVYGFIDCLKTLTIKYDLNPRWLLLSSGSYSNLCDNILNIMEYLLSVPNFELKLMGERSESALKDLQIGVEDLSAAVVLDKTIIFLIFNGECRDVDAMMYFFIFLNTHYDINIDYILTGDDQKFRRKESIESIENKRLTDVLNASRFDFNKRDKVLYVDDINIFRAFLIIRDEKLNLLKGQKSGSLRRVRVNLRAVKLVFNRCFFNLFKSKSDF